MIGRGVCVNVCIIKQAVSMMTSFCFTRSRFGLATRRSGARTGTPRRSRRRAARALASWAVEAAPGAPATAKRRCVTCAAVAATSAARFRALLRPRAPPGLRFPSVPVADSDDF